MTNRRQKSLARRCERIATCDVVWKGASGSARHGISMHVFFLVWCKISVGPISLVGCELCPDQASGKGKTDGPKPSKSKDNAKVGEPCLPILSGNLLILSSFDNIMIRTCTCNFFYFDIFWYILWYCLLFGYIEWLLYVVVIWAIVGHCGMLHCQAIQYFDVYWFCMLNYTDVFCICFGLPKVQQVDLDVQGTLDLPFYRILSAPGDWWQIEGRKA